MSFKKIFNINVDCLKKNMSVQSIHIHQQCPTKIHHQSVSAGLDTSSSSSVLMLLGAQQSSKRHHLDIKPNQQYKQH
jgi:hypothetical protein